MNRTDRLYALSEELRRAGTRGRMSAQLAATSRRRAKKLGARLWVNDDPTEPPRAR